MSHNKKHTISRRAVLGGAAGLWLARPGAAQAAGPDRDLIALRRDLHRNPEVAGQEQRTAATVAKELRAAGLEVTTGVGGHGVVGVLTGARPGRTVAYRADMDAVAPQDQVNGDGRVAHVCGHDIHTTVGVGVAQVLARLRERLAGTVVFVFQPAEETLTGAAAMLAHGAFAGTRPTEIHALHCYAFPVGQFMVTPGTGLPGQDRGVVTVTGPDAAARAQRLATEIGALGTVSRPGTPEELSQLVDDIQRPSGPLARFVFLTARASGAEVRVAFRCWPEARYAEIREDIRRLAGTVAGASVSFPDHPFPAVVTPVRQARALQRYLHSTVGLDRTRVAHAAVPFSGDDFALFLDRMPGTYTFLGVRGPDTKIEDSYPHFGDFCPDERAIGHGVRAMAGWLATRAHGMDGAR